MRAAPRKILMLVACLAGLAASFLLGRFSADLKASLASEAAYPWGLHKKLSAIDVRCESLLTAPASGQFKIQPIEGGSTLLISRFNRETGLVTGVALDAGGQMASDSWQVDCK